MPGYCLYENIWYVCIVTVAMYQLKHETIIVKYGLQRMAINLLTRQLLERCLDFHLYDSFVTKR